MQPKDKKDRITPFIGAARETLAAEEFVRLLLSRNEGGEADLKKISVRRVMIKNAPMLAFTYQYKTRDIVKNHGEEDGLALAASYLEDGFKAGVLFTTRFDLSYPSLTRAKPTQKDVPDAAHDRSKNRHLETAGKNYLHALGITDANGKVHKNAQDKFRQIDKYIETVAALLAQNPSGDIRRIADMGAGKGYLTFALYDYLTGLGHGVEVTGVEMRKDLVDICNKIAGENDFSGLSFVEGTIAGYDCAGTDMLVALHACDTATDDAIFKGIRAGAKIIVTAPCCHKQIRREMERGAGPDDFDFLLRHGVFMERQAEMVTDGLRALLLEKSGYAVKAFEFISDAHTPKNVMITAVKDSRLLARADQVQQKITAAKQTFGIGRHHLEDLLQQK